MKYKNVIQIALPLLFVFSGASLAQEMKKDCTALLEQQILAFEMFDKRKSEQVENLRLSKSDCEVFDSLTMNRKSVDAVKYADQVIEAKKKAKQQGL